MLPLRPFGYSGVGPIVHEQVQATELPPVLQFDMPPNV
jgi:hypothetical protein